MSTIALKDQLGAMSIIDELRHRSLQVDEHLDMPSRRDEVAERIRDYYRQTGVPVTDELIAQGVSEFFDRRLRFEAPQLTGMQKRLAAVYVSRAQWWPTARMAGLVLTAGLSLGTGVFMLQSYLDGRALQGEVAQSNEQLTDLQGSFVSIEKTLQSLKLSKPAFAASVVADRLANADANLERAHSLTSLPSIHYEDDRASRQAERNKVSTRAKLLSVAQAALDLASQQLKEAADLVSTDKALQEARASSAFARYAAAYPALQMASDFAEHQLKLGQGNGAKLTVAKVSGLLSAANKADVLTAAIHSSVAETKSLGVAGEDLVEVTTVENEAITALRKLDVAAAELRIEQLSTFHEMAATPLRLEIVSRSGVKSGVERTYNESGGKAWYLVVEAHKPDGEVMPILVKSAESGQQTMTKLFAVRVPQEVYQRVKQDKKDDGHIDDVLVGNKPVGRLHFDFTKPAQPEYILEW